MEAMGNLPIAKSRPAEMIDMGGLMPLATGVQVRIKDGELKVIDGPFVEAKEVIGGYAIFEFRNKEEALASAEEFMQLHTSICRAGKGPAKFARWPGRKRQVPGPPGRRARQRLMRGLLESSRRR